MTKERLQEYRWIRKNINTLIDTLTELEAKAGCQSPRLSDEPRVAGISDQVGEAASTIADTRLLLYKKIKAGQKMLEAIEAAIEILPEREKYLVRLRYISGHSWESICVEMNYSWKQTHRIHANALILLET